MLSSEHSVRAGSAKGRSPARRGAGPEKQRLLRRAGDAFRLASPTATCVPEMATMFPLERPGKPLSISSSGRSPPLRFVFVTLPPTCDPDYGGRSRVARRRTGAHTSARPKLSAKEIAEARRSMEDAAFAHDRLQAALPRLQERLKDLQDAEQDARRWIAYRKAEAERDKLAMNSPASTRRSPRSSRPYAAPRRKRCTDRVHHQLRPSIRCQTSACCGASPRFSHC